MNEERSLSQAVAQVLRAELAARRINGPTFAGMVGESGSNVWRKIEGYVKISFDDLDRYAAALDLSVRDVMDQAVELQKSGHVHPPVTLSEHVTRQLGADAQEAVRKAKATRTKRTRQAPPNGQ